MSQNNSTMKSALTDDPPPYTATAQQGTPSDPTSTQQPQPGGYPQPSAYPQPGFYPQAGAYPQPSSSPYPPPPPGYTPYNSAPPQGSTFVPNYGATHVVIPPTIIAVGGCPACRVGILEDDFTCLGILMAIIFFPIGILCCLILKNRRCTNCGAYFA